MSTLSRWHGKFSKSPTIIECREMRLQSASDPEPIFTGSGHIELTSSSGIWFTMHARTRNERAALRRFAGIGRDPRDPDGQCRLAAVDYTNTEWTGGWTLPLQKNPLQVGWLLTGSLGGLATTVTGPWVSAESGVELVFVPKLRVPMERSLVTVSTVDGLEVERIVGPGQQTVRVLDTDVRFFYMPGENVLWVTARTSSRLTHPYAENRLSEPLRILLGRLAYPRLVARNFGDGRALISILPSASHQQSAHLVSLIGTDPGRDPEEFWRLYAQLLKYIVSEPCENVPGNGSHQLTQYYEELIQATDGSKWVLCMSLANVIEGLVRLLLPKSGTKPKVENFLKSLVSEGVVTEVHRRAWSRVRNEVMHGTLLPLWSTREEEDRIQSLAELVRLLTRHLLEKAGTL